MKITPGEVEVVSNKSKLGAGAIPISSLNPDRDGDGKIEKWEQEVFDRIKAADADQSGSISVKELFSVIKQSAANPNLANTARTGRLGTVMRGGYR